MLTSYTMAPNTSKNIPQRNSIPSGTQKTKTGEAISLVALPGLDPGLFALRGRRVNQLHHNAKTLGGQEETLSSRLIEYSKSRHRTQANRIGNEPLTDRAS